MQCSTQPSLVLKSAGYYYLHQTRLCTEGKAEKLDFVQNPLGFFWILFKIPLNFSKLLLAPQACSVHQRESWETKFCSISYPRIFLDFVQNPRGFFKTTTCTTVVHRAPKRKLSNWILFKIPCSDFLYQSAFWNPYCLEYFLKTLKRIVKKMQRRLKS